MNARLKSSELIAGLRPGSDSTCGAWSCRAGSVRWWWCVASPKCGVVHLVVGQRRAVVRHPAVAHHDRPVDQRRHRAELVGDQHDRGCRAPSWPQGVGEDLLVGQVDAGGRLVEEEQLRARRPAPGRSAPAAAGRRTAGETPSLARSASPTTSSASSMAVAVGAARAGAAAGAGSSRPDATTSQTEAGTPEVAPARCGTKPIRCQSWKSSSGVPKSRSDPVASGRRPVSARTSVDLPEPLAPISATNSPGRTVRSMPRRTGRPPIATAPSVEPDRHLGCRRGQQPFASWRAARLRRMSER